MNKQRSNDNPQPMLRQLGVGELRHGSPLLRQLRFIIVVSSLIGHTCVIKDRPPLSCSIEKSYKSDSLLTGNQTHQENVPGITFTRVWLQLTAKAQFLTWSHLSCRRRSASFSSCSLFSFSRRWAASSFFVSSVLFCSSTLVITGYQCKAQKENANQLSADEPRSAEQCRQKVG